MYGCAVLAPPTSGLGVAASVGPRLEGLKVLVGVSPLPLTTCKFVEVGAAGLCPHGAAMDASRVRLTRLAVPKVHPHTLPIVHEAAVTAVRAGEGEEGRARGKRA